ncbi:MAG TPA: hypothetical protein VN577_02115 [Terriglobales bacterium]|nr:hypothetical protein [Terriglobales bacterium]
MPTVIRWLTAAFLLCAFLPASAQERAAIAKPKPQASAEVRQLLLDADSLPIEYRADIQLDVLESNPNIPAKIASSTLERLYQDARTAQYPFKLADITGDHFSRSRKLEQALTLSLDTLSIQARVITIMFRVNPARARQMLQDLRIDVPSTGCESPTIPDIWPFYYIAAKVRTDASRKLMEIRAASNLIDNQIATTTSSVQLAPLAILIFDTVKDPDELRRLTSLYSQKLRDMVATDRELGFIENASVAADPKLQRRLRLVQTRTTLSNAIASLAARSPADGTTELLNAYRAFLIGSGGQPACADITSDRNKIAATFNQLLSRFPSQANAVRAIGPEELRSKSSGKSAVVELIPNAAELSRGATYKLSELQRANAYPASEDGNPLAFDGWESDVNEALSHIGAAHEDSTCSACSFYQKQELLMVLFDLTPNGATRERVLDYLLAFMSQTSLRQDSRVEWLYKFKLLLNLSRTASAEDAKRLRNLQDEGKRLLFLPAEDKNQILDAIRRQNDVIMLQYLNADRVLKKKYEMPPY